MYSTCQCVRDGFYTVFGVVASEVEVLLGVCWFVVDICDDFAIYVFTRMSKNGSSFRLCSIVNFILGCRFCSSSCNSLMSPHGYFQYMKQSSKYLFHDLVKSSFMLLPYFLPIFSCRFSSKYARVRIAYVGAIFVPMAIPSVWI